MWLSILNHAGIVKHSTIIENKIANNFKYFISPHSETSINIIEIIKVLQEFNIYCLKCAIFSILNCLLYMCKY